MQRTTIVIPCFNEAARLKPQPFRDALAAAEQLSFLFVDDGSTDATRLLLTSLQAEWPERIDLLALPQNMGKGEAVRQGMLRAIAGPAAYVGYWDADLATPLEAIGRFAGLLDAGDHDLVLGARVLLLGRRIERRPLRHYLGRIFATCASLLLDLGVYDTQCGAKLFRNQPLLRQVFGMPFRVSWIFDVELLARYALLQGMSPREAGVRWVEYPLEAWIDVKGSKVRGADYLRAGLDFLTLLYHLHTPARRAYHAALTGRQ